MALETIFANGDERKRRRRAKKTGGGGVKGDCAPGKGKCKIPFVHKSKMRGKIPKVKVSTRDGSSKDKEEFDDASHTNPRFLR